MFEHETHELLREINHTLKRGFAEILAALKHTNPVPIAVEIVQIYGGKKMPITGTNVGGNSTFEADAILAGAADPAGFPAGSVDTWTTDDPTIGIGPDSGPNNSQVVVSLPSTYTKPDYGLTVSVQMPGSPAPAPLTMTVRVPAIAAAPPPPDGVAINQIA